jgi:hypothetical protein
MLKIKTYPTLEAMRHLNEVRGKFVQISWKGEPWLLFASKDQHQFHNQIVAHFMSEQHLSHHWHSPEVLRFEQLDLEISGGGKFQLNWQDKCLILSANSMVYGRFQEEGLMASLQQAGMPWSEFMIIIE